MCDYRPGELIAAFADEDREGSRLVDSIHSGKVHDVRVADDLTSRIRRSDVGPRLRWNAYLLEVPEGQELWHIHRLQHEYGPRALTIGVNSYLTLEGFALSPDHASYKSMLGFLRGATGRGVTIAVVDSGIESRGTIPGRTIDLITPNGPGDDRNGHGTAVTSVIHDVAPNAVIDIVKVTDADPVEWDALAGLVTASTADVINLSLSFGNATRVCALCGRQSISSRSIVFEAIVHAALDQPHEPVIVAAAGNQAQGQLRYPARFGEIVAVGAVDASGSRAPYSNYGAVDADGQPHANLFFAPGGEAAHPVGTATTPLPYHQHFATSLATAYATGVVACARETRGKARSRILADLRAAATPLPGHVSANDGNGLIQGC